MNPIRQYELKYITFEQLENQLWEFGKNSIAEVGERCFKFYIDKACKWHNYNYYIERFDSREIIHWNCIEDQNNQDDPFTDFL